MNQECRTCSLSETVLVNMKTGRVNDCGRRDGATTDVQYRAGNDGHGILFILISALNAFMTSQAMIEEMV